jgi:uncharacterized protein
MITLGVSNMRASVAFYEALGFKRKFRATGEVVAFFDTGGTAIGLFPWDQLAQDVTLPDPPGRRLFAGSRWRGIAARSRRSMPCWILPSRRARHC